MAFMGIKPGARVKFYSYAGMGLKGPEYVERFAKVNRLLIFDTHVCVKYGWAGTVVDARNYITHRNKE